MRDYIILTDSSCDLPAQLAEELHLRVLPLRFRMGQNEYHNYLDGREISISDFYQRLRDGETATTSAVNAMDFAAAMGEELSAGRDVLCLAFSSGLSATCQSAFIAAEQVRKDHPEGRVEVVDTLCASGGQGLLVWLCANEKAAGKSLDEVRDYAENIKGKVCHWVTVNDLNHLKRGGRISAATAMVGTMLNVKPIIHVDDAGKLETTGKARGRKAAIQTLIDRAEQTAIRPEEQTMFVTHGDCQAEAEAMAEEVRRRLHVKDVVISHVGPVIGSHTGPGVMVLFFLGEPR